MPQIGELATHITAYTEPFERATKRAGAKTRQFARDVEHGTQSLGSRFSPALTKARDMLVGPMGITAGIAAATQTVRKFSGAILEEGGALDAIGKLSTRTGASTESLLGLQFIAGQTGASWQQVANGLQAFNKRTGEAARGMGEAKRAFEYLNINAEEFARLDLTERLKIISDALNGMESEAMRASVAAQLFSDVGKKEMLNMLQLGSKGIEELTQTAKKLGITMRDDVVKSIERSNDAMDRMKQRQAGLKRQMTAELIPAIGATIEELEALQEQYGLFSGDKSRSTGAKLLDMAMNPGSLGLGPSMLYDRAIARGKQQNEEERTKLLNQGLRERGQNPKDSAVQQEQLKEQKKTNWLLQAAARPPGVNEVKWIIDRF